MISAFKIIVRNCGAITCNVSEHNHRFNEDCRET